MTRDELIKRLVKVDASPQRNVSTGRDSVRRDMNAVEISSVDDSEFDNFFDFEKDIGEIESARSQLEKISNLEPIKEILEPVNSFVTIEEDLEAKSGDPESFFIFEESSEDIQTTTTSHIKEEYIEIKDNENIENSTLEVEVLEILENQDEETVKSDAELDNISVAEFKFCKYVRESGPCKRQAPKYNDYCSAHRKLLAKQLDKER